MNYKYRDKRGYLDMRNIEMQVTKAMKVLHDQVIKLLKKDGDFKPEFTVNSCVNLFFTSNSVIE